MRLESDRLDREFDVVMDRFGLEVPEAWREGAVAAYREMRGMAAKMRQPRNAESAPSNVFFPEVLLRAR